MTSIYSGSVPVAVLSGFLGSGKSTLLNALLRDPATPPIAVVINEFGEIGIDNHLIESVVDGVALLSSGCVCCSTRSDLEQTLQDLYLKRMRGVVPDFRGVVLETTGLAEPGPVLQTLASRPVREKRYGVGPVLTTVDAQLGLSSLARHHEAVEQVALADRLLITKSDLCTAAELGAVQARLPELNPLAAAQVVDRNRLEPRELLGDLFFGDARSLRAEAEWSRRVDERLAALQSRHHHHHSSTVEAYCYVLPGPLDWEVVSAALKTLTEKFGEQVLRVKGLLDLAGLDQPVVVQGVRHLLYPTEALPAWPEGPRESRLVIIAQNLDRAAVDAAIAPLRAAKAG